MGLQKFILVFFLVIILAFAIFMSKEVTSFAIKLNPPLVQGQSLQGTFTVDPASVGAIPLDSIVRIELNTLSLEYPLAIFLSSFYLAKNVQDNGEFAPILTATFVVGEASVIFPEPPSTGGSGGSGCSVGDVNCYSTTNPCATEPDQKNCLGTGDNVNHDEFIGLTGLTIYTQFIPTIRPEESVREFILVFNRDSPASFTLDKGESYLLKEVLLYGEPVSAELISVTENGQKIEVSTTYAEELSTIDSTGDPIEISLSELGIVIPPRGDLTLKVLYRNQLLVQSDASFYAFHSFPGDFDSTRLLTNSPLIPGAPLPKELIAKGCGAYVCNDWGSCSVEPLKELISVERTLSLVQARECLLDCGISFTQNKPCELDKKLISVVPIREPEQTDGSGGSDSSGSSGGSSSRTVSLFDQRTATPVAEIELESIGGFPVLNIILTQSQRALSIHCYNGALDLADGEEDVDCGGFCKACVNESMSRFVVMLWVLVGLGILGFFIVVRSSYAR